MCQFRAQPPAVAMVLIDDPVVRIVRWGHELGADTGHHLHGLDYVVVPMADCRFLVEEERGSRRVDVAKGAAFRRGAGVAHNVVNAGSEPISFIETEYK